MESVIYFCSNDKNNNCPQKDKCKRYINSMKDNCKTTLYKEACTKDNNYHLFIEEIRKENEK